MSTLDEAELQLSELEMLGSVFPHAGEMTIPDPGPPAELARWVQHPDEPPPRGHVGFTVRHPTIAGLDAVCHFPHHYPTQPPEIYARADWMGRAEQGRLNGELRAFLREHAAGTLRVLAALDWLADNAPPLHAASAAPAPVPGGPSPRPRAAFSRLWIYSHHIYNKDKRRDLVSWARDLDLTGFLMPGKPGLVCAEGPATACDEYWARVRRLQWQKIGIRHREDFPPIAAEGPGGTAGESSPLPRFEPPFREEAFDVHGTHMDLGQLRRFLEGHGCSEAFTIVFGVEKK